MKHINFKLGIKVFIMAFVFLINMLGCTKDKIVAEKNIDPNVISEIKKIVGQNGEIKLLSNSINLSSQTFKLNNDTVKLLSLLEFKSAFDLFGVEDEKKEQPHQYAQDTYINDDEEPEENMNWFPNPKDE